MRNIKARGKRPWATNIMRGSSDRAKYYDDISHFQCSLGFENLLTRGEALRVAQRLPLAFIFRAFGAGPIRIATFVQSPAHDFDPRFVKECK